MKWAMNFLPCARPTFLARFRSVTIAFCMIVPIAALAELSDESLLGPGVRSRPAYDGSASQLVEFVPVVRYLGEPWFVRTTQSMLEGGVRLEVAPGLHFGAQLAYEPGRETSESAFLTSHNVEDVDRGSSVGGHVEWDHTFGPMPVTLLVRARQNTAFNRGAQVDVRPSVGVFRSGPISAGVFAQATWANAKSADTLYGVTPQQSVATGLPVFSASGGWLFASLGLLGSVALSSNWLMVGSTESRHLCGDVARSPLAERVSNYYAALGLAYRF